MRLCLLSHELKVKIIKHRYLQYTHTQRERHTQTLLAKNKRKMNKEGHDN